MQAFWNECAECGLQFDSLSFRGEHGPFVYNDGKGVLQYLDPDDDPVWDEASTLIEHEIGTRIADFDQAALFHRLLAQTIDHPFGSAWEKSPCPRCGSRERSGYGPHEPPRFQNMELPPVTHARWSALPAEEKRAMARRAAGR